MPCPRKPPYRQPHVTQRPTPTHTYACACACACTRRCPKYHASCMQSFFLALHPSCCAVPVLQDCQMQIGCGALCMQSSRTDQAIQSYVFSLTWCCWIPSSFTTPLACLLIPGLCVHSYNCLSSLPHHDCSTRTSLPGIPSDLSTSCFLYLVSWTLPRRLHPAIQLAADS